MLTIDFDFIVVLLSYLSFRTKRRIDNVWQHFQFLIGRLGRSADVQAQYLFDKVVADMHTFSIHCDHMSVELTGIIRAGYVLNNMHS